MAIRTITWTVDEKLRITPRHVQDAGVQGDNNATRVVFSLPAFLQERYTLYIECVDSVGEGDKTDPLAVIDGAVSFDLPLKWTQHGGEATLRLVAEVEGVVAYTAIGRVRYDGRATAFAKMKSLVEISIQAAQDRIAKMIADAKLWIDNVNGVYVGSGDMPDGCVIQIDPEGEALLLDNELSDTSENVPKTKVVKAYVDNVAKECVLYPGCFYRSSRYGGMEWLNPPMLPGVEYLTTERHNGKPVWVKLVELGSLPIFDDTYGVDSDKDGNYERAVKSVEVIRNGEIHWFDVWATTPTDKRMQQMPFHSSDGSLLSKVDANNGNRLSVYTYTGGLSKYSAHALVKFTRPNIAPATMEWERRMLERIDLAMLHTVALRDVPKSPNGVTAAGDILTGINYSSVYDLYQGNEYTYDEKVAQLVGFGTSLSTYYSALENPASVMYAAGDISDRTDVSTYYGISCSAFVSYVFGWNKWVWTSKMIDLADLDEDAFKNKYKGETKKKCRRLAITSESSVEDLYQVRRGDMVVKSGHARLVMDVLYSEDGTLVGFNIVESVSPYVQVIFKTPEAFLAQMSEANPYCIIRFDDSEYGLDVETVEYSKSVYPDMGDGGKYTVGDEVQLYIPDIGATAITVNGTTMALADLETTTVNDVTVYKLPVDKAGTYIIATDIAPDDPCTVIVKEAK